MKTIVLLFLLAFTHLVHAQKNQALKSRFYGTYQGEIAAYKMNTGNEVINIQPVAISIRISKESISFDIGQKKQEGSYKVLFEVEKYYVIEAKLEDQFSLERIVVFKQGNVISRDGFFPQPSVYLKKMKK